MQQHGCMSGPKRQLQTARRRFAGEEFLEHEGVSGEAPGRFGF
jgi:hypothetical protein